MFAAGSLVNLITALLFLALISSLFYSNPQGILVVDTIPGYPAHGVIPKYSVIMELNGTKILSISDLTNFMRSAKPGDLVMVKYIDPNGDLREAALRLKADIKNKTRPMMGVNIVNFFKSRIDLSIRSSYELWNFLLTTHIISLSVAIFNMLPIYPFDGARFLFSLLERGIKKTHLLKIIKVCIMTVAVILLALNIAFTFM
ncbi:MAG: hypothetical protein DRJ66_05440 [Thermoprotei archaeon]|nr:MAG: hypothetical protein DRJ66_05440 [Thermoprotei archaeon]